MRLRGLLVGEFPALPLDLFRAAAGLVCLAYFTEELARFGDFTAPGGLLDHAFIARVYWFSRLSLFQPGAAEWWLKGCLAAAWLACWGLILGWRARACAGLAFAVAVSLFRWNLIVMEIDDAVVSLLLLWLILLPTGKTLVAGRFLEEGVWKRWRRESVPAATVRCLQANALLVYLVAGLSKLRSPFWRQGFALYATLRLPMSRTADFWGPRHLALLSAATHIALAVELSLPLLLAAPRGSVLKRLGLLCQLGFHAGIIALFGLPYVNAAMAATSLLFSAEDPALGLRPPGPPAAARPAPLRPESRAALALVCLLALTVSYDWPVIGALSGPAGAVLWVAGISQDYHLFDWIDDKNYRVADDLLPEPPAGGALFPNSTRGYLLRGYLHDVRWTYVPCGRRPALKRGILERSARRACANGLGAGGHQVYADLVRITPDDPGLERLRRKFMMAFACREGGAELLGTFDVEAQAPDCRPGARKDAVERLAERF